MHREFYLKPYWTICFLILFADFLYNLHFITRWDTIYYIGTPMTWLRLYATGSNLNFQVRLLEMGLNLVIYYVLICCFVKVSKILINKIKSKY